MRDAAAMAGAATQRPSVGGRKSAACRVSAYSRGRAPVPNHRSCQRMNSGSQAVSYTHLTLPTKVLV